MSSARSSRSVDLTIGLPDMSWKREMSEIVGWDEMHRRLLIKVRRFPAARAERQNSGPISRTTSSFDALPRAIVEQPAFKDAADATKFCAGASRSEDSLV